VRANDGEKGDSLMLDSQIIELYWARSEQAIRAGDERYGPYCNRIAMNILSNREDCEECVNDTWLRAWNSMPPQRPDSLAAFFGRIVRNLSISRYRLNHAQKRHTGIMVLLSELEDCVASGSTPEQVVENKLLAEAISNWLVSLSKDDRALFVRRYWFGDALRTLARECGVTQNQMAQRMLRLRKRLKVVLEQEGITL